MTLDMGAVLRRISETQPYPGSLKETYSSLGVPERYRPGLGIRGDMVPSQSSR